MNILPSVLLVTNLTFSKKTKFGPKTMIFVLALRGCFGEASMGNNQVLLKRFRLFNDRLGRRLNNSLPMVCPGAARVEGLATGSKNLHCGRRFMKTAMNVRAHIT